MISPLGLIFMRIFYGKENGDMSRDFIESLGLGTCMLGAIHPFIQSGKAAEKFRKNHGIKFKSKEGLFLIAGYPKVKFRHGVRRTFANIDNN